MELLGAVIAGAFIGAVLGFVGAGGAMVSVPILIYFFDFDPKSATTAALAIVFLTALSGSIPKARNSQILYREAFVVVGIGLFTNLGFALSASKFPDEFVTTGFAVVLIIAALSMLVSPQFRPETRMPLPVLILISLLIGSLTGIFGIGGGFLAIPVLVLFFGTPPAKAAGTSLLIISLNSLISLLGHYALWDSVAWQIPIYIGVSAIVFAQIASHFSTNTSPKILRTAFAILLIVIAILTLLDTWIVENFQISL
jgi:uncharacterized membrane protein YfcA